MNLVMSEKDYKKLESVVYELSSRLPAPESVENPDFTDLIDQCRAFVIDNIAETGYYERAFQEIIFMQAMVCIYGPGIVKYLRNRDC